jgi:HD superfamily phosphodiesterase
VAGPDVINSSIMSGANAQGRQRKLRFDPNLLYVAAAFHDLGLIKKFSSQDERFEVDSANAARQFLDAHGISEDQVQTVWEAIALHTTPGIPKHMRPEIALLVAALCPWSPTD